jgi:membrane-associated phospholipid phosphatase
VLVALGAFTWLDQFAVDHLMPFLEFDDTPSTLAEALLPLIGAQTPWDVFVDLWLYPASFPLSGLILIGCAFALRRWGRTVTGVLWLAAWFFGTAIEALTKGLLARPDLFFEGRRIEDFAGSLPSGHTLRSFLLAAAITSLWPRAGRIAWAWTLSVWVLLIVQGWHTPTDVVGGILLAWALTLAVREGAAYDAKLLRVDRGADRAPAGHEREPRAVETEP